MKQHYSSACAFDRDYPSIPAAAVAPPRDQGDRFGVDRTGETIKERARCIFVGLGAYPSGGAALRHS